MSLGKIFKLFICSGIIATGICLPAGAQTPPATSFLQVQSLLDSGKSVQITDDKGSVFKGKVVIVSNNSITLTKDGIRRDFLESSVRQIRQRRPDVWWNGMLIGMGVGFATGFASVKGVCGNDSECSFYAGLAFIPLLTGIGAGAGAAIDFGIKKYDPVYIRPEVPTRGALRISPILSPDTKGLRLSLSF